MHPSHLKKAQQMRNAIDAVELALNEFSVNERVRLLEGAHDSVIVKVPLGAVRRLASCYPELNRIINDPAFDIFADAPKRKRGQ